MQDRLDALTIFAAVAEQQSFAEAARHLSRSPASVTRAVAALEERLQTRLFNRTTRSVALTDAGARYLEGCRRFLATYDELEAVNLSERAQPRGWINVTAPTMFGRLHVLPIVRSFLGEYPQVDVRMLLLDRVVSLVDEGLDLGVRIGQLPDSSLRAVRVGQVRRVVCAAPQYIARHGVPITPRDLGSHTVVACTAVTPIPDRWSFHGPSGVTSVAVKPRLVVNTTAGAVDAAVDGLGFTCVRSYQAEPHVAAGRLQTVLTEYEPPPAPIHIVHPEGRYLPTKVRLFLDHAASALRAKFGKK
ncbi:MAG: LysR family transcriptional regulator [Alphaproteobacteria bacterium]|nr:LysR family transcriptional regulator [Alphaproteobacteria bacterium]